MQAVLLLAKLSGDIATLLEVFGNVAIAIIDPLQRNQAVCGQNLI